MDRVKYFVKFLKSYYFTEFRPNLFNGGQNKIILKVLFLYTKFRQNRSKVLQTNQIGWRIGHLFKFKQRSREKIIGALTSVTTHLTYLPPYLPTAHLPVQTNQFILLQHSTTKLRQLTLQKSSVVSA